MTTTSKYMNPFTDFGFKKLFGEDDAKVYLADFLNSLLSGHIAEITDIIPLKSEMLGRAESDRSAIFDLYCKTNHGERIIIELQKVAQRNFKDRSLFYSSFAIQEQNQKGKIDGKDWDFKLDAVYCVGILNFNFSDKKDKYLHIGRLLDVDDHDVLIENINFAFFEAPKFRKTMEECHTKQDQWLYAFCNLQFLDQIPQNLTDDHHLLDFFHNAEMNALKGEDRARYEDSLKYFRDLHNVEQLNLDKGRIEEKLKIAQNMKNKGFDIKIIADITTLTIEEVQAL